MNIKIRNMVHINDYTISASKAGDALYAEYSRLTNDLALPHST